MLKSAYLYLKSFSGIFIKLNLHILKNSTYKMVPVGLSTISGKSAKAFFPEKKLKCKLK